MYTLENRQSETKREDATMAWIGYKNCSVNLDYRIFDNIQNVWQSHKFDLKSHEKLCCILIYKFMQDTYWRNDKQTP